MEKRTLFSRFILLFFIFFIVGSHLFLCSIDIKREITISANNDDLSHNIPIKSRNDTIIPIQFEDVNRGLLDLDKNLNLIEDELDTILKIFSDDYVVDVLIDVENNKLHLETERFRKFGKVNEIIGGRYYSGFSGRINVKGLINYVKTSDSYSFIRLNKKAQYTLRNSLEQLRIYPNLRNKYSLKGDNYSTIAILDQGIDDSHPSLKNKTIYWKDFTSDNWVDPQDPRGHGTQVASVACGKPYNSTDFSGRTIHTNFLYYDYSSSGLDLNKKYYQTIRWLNLTHEGNITIEGNWFNPNPSQTPVNITEIIFVNSSHDIKAKQEILINQTFVLTYEINSTNFGLYQIKSAFNITSLTNPVVGINLTIHLPENNSDIENLYSGVAPNTQVIMLRCITESEIIQALNWILENYTVKNITTVIMSFIINSVIVRNLAEQLVSKGIIVSCSAGNDYYGSNYAGAGSHAPGCADKVISVGAVNHNNSLASYSAQGGYSPTGNTIKPDIVAPGGEFPSYYIPNYRIYCSDSNDKEYLYDPFIGKYEDINVNDTTGVTGTSFSAPIVGGVAQLIIEKLGGIKNWDYSQSEALFVKNLMLLTATETYPNKRGYYPDYSPSLDRGVKDIHEGYGVINPDACIDALTYTISMNSSEINTLYSIETFNGLRQTCWVKMIDLHARTYYDLNLTIPASADFDLFLYDYSGNQFGEPIVISKSCNIGLGTSESLHKFVPPETGKYFLAVKGVSGYGDFSILVQKLNLTYDDTPPNSSILMPQDGYTGWGTIFISGTSTDDLSEIKNVTLIIESRAGYENYTIVNPPLVFNYSWKTSILDDGVSYIKIKAFDSLGNGGYSKVVSIIVRNIFILIPVVSITTLICITAVIVSNKLAVMLLTSEKFMDYVDKFSSMLRKPTKAELRELISIKKVKNMVNSFRNKQLTKTRLKQSISKNLD